MKGWTRDHQDGWVRVQIIRAIVDVRGCGIGIGMNAVAEMVRKRVKEAFEIESLFLSEQPDGVVLAKWVIDGRASSHEFRYL